MLRRLLIMTSAVVLGCTFEVDYRGKRITCTGAADCPKGACSRSLGRCVPVGLETEPPVLTLSAPLTPATGRVGTTFRLSLTASEPLDRLPSVRAGFDRGGQITFDSADALDASQWTFEWEAPADTPTGVARVQIAGVDLAGNETVVAEQPTFVIDVDPPRPSIAGVVLFPPAESPRPSVDALAPQGRAVIAFAFDEPIDSGVELTALPPVLACEPVTVQTGQFAFSCVLDGGLGQEGPISVFAKASDLVGNTGTAALTLVPPLRFDTIPPAFDLDAGLTHLRVPVAVPPGTRAIQQVIGGPGAIEPGVLVQAFFLSTALELGRAVASDAGSLLIDLGTSDRRGVTVRACDSAGNLSPTLAVKDVEYRDAPGPGDNTTAVTMGASSSRLDRAELVPLVGASLLRQDGVGQLIEGRPSWFRRGIQWVPASGSGVEPCLSYDEVRATPVAQAATSILFYSGRDFFRPLTVTTPRGNGAMAFDRRRGVNVIWGGTGSQATEVLEVREQTMRTVVSSGPALRVKHALVWDGQGVQLLGDGPPGLGWRWDGQRWQRLDAGVMPMGPVVAAYDSRRDEVLAVASADGGEPGTWRYRGGGWGQLAVDGGPSTSIGSMVYDPEADRFLFNSVRADGGADVFGFGSEQWTRLTPGLGTLRGPNASTWAAFSSEWLAISGPSRNELYAWSADAGFVLRKRSTGEFAPNAMTDFSAAQIGTSLFVFGGTAATATTEFVYRWDGDSWLTLPRAPVSKRNQKMVYLPGANEVVMAGGLRDLPAVNDTSAWRVQLLPDAGWPPDGGGWIELVDAGPLPRAFGVMVETSSTEALFFGGAPGNADTQPWRYTAGAFTPSPVPLLGPRHRQAASFEPGLGVVVSGGSPSSGTTPNADAPVWLVTPASVVRLDAGLPKPRAMHSSIFDSRRGEHVIFGGFGDATLGENSLNDVVRVALRDGGVTVTADVPDDPEGDGNPSARNSHFAFWDDARAKMVVFGGRNLARVENDVWEYSTEQNRPALVVFVSTDTLDVQGVETVALELSVVAGGDGELNQAPVEGVTVELFGGGRWRPLGTMGGSAAAPQPMVFTSTIEHPQFHWGTLERFAIRLSTTGQNGRGFAKLFVDQVSVRLRFTRP